MLGKETIQHLLATDDRAIARALLVLTERQTADEQASENTRYLNGMGFRPCHARMGTSMAKFFQRNGYLTAKQLNYWRGKDRAGNTRIGIYWKQLQEAAAMKAAKSNGKVLTPPLAIAPAATPVSQPTMPTSVTGDLGNDMERKMVLQEILDDAALQPRSDTTLTDALAKEIAEIDAFWAKMRKQG